MLCFPRCRSYKTIIKPKPTLSHAKYNYNNTVLKSSTMARSIFNPWMGPESNNGKKLSKVNVTRDK